MKIHLGVTVPVNMVANGYAGVTPVFSGIGPYSLKTAIKKFKLTHIGKNLLSNKNAGWRQGQSVLGDPCLSYYTRHGAAFAINGNNGVVTRRLLLPLIANAALCRVY